MKAVELWGLWGEGAGVKTLSRGSMSAIPPGDRGQPGWRGLGGEEECEVIWEV